jgi:hypothetical protein
MELRAKRGDQFLTAPQPDAQAQAVPVDWQALAISRYERMEEYRVHAEALAAAGSKAWKAWHVVPFDNDAMTKALREFHSALAAWEKEAGK